VVSLYRLLFLIRQLEELRMAKLLAKVISSPNLFRLEPLNSVSVRLLRGRAPEAARTLKQRLEEIARNKKDPSLYFNVNIGLPFLKASRAEDYRQRQQHLRSLKSSSELNETSEISLEEVRKEWLKTSGPFHIKTIVEHFNIFEDLYGEAYFVPRVPLDISYNFTDDVVTPVCYGNQIKPNEAKNAPNINYEAEPSSLWCLLLTNPDGHFTEPDAEYVHWFIGNIPGNDISKGEEIVNYLQPFPPRGTGSQRMIFVLYKQEKLIDFTPYKRASPCLNLGDRTFRTKKFYRDLQDSITPAGISFYQSDWDDSLPAFFHNKLGMREPIYEFDFPVPYRKPAVWFPKKEAFNLYMDKHRDSKQIAKELLLKRLKEVDPFQPKRKEPKYPNAFPEDNSQPSWLRTEIRKQRLKWGRYSDS